MPEGQRNWGACSNVMGIYSCPQVGNRLTERQKFGLPVASQLPPVPPGLHYESTGAKNNEKQLKKDYPGLTFNIKKRFDTGPPECTTLFGPVI